MYLLKSALRIYLCSFFLIVNCFGIRGEESGIERIFDQFIYLPDSVLFEKGESFLMDNKSDSALLCYSFIYNKYRYSEDREELKTATQALNKAFRVYFYNCDYRKGLEVLSDALDICEKINYEEYIGHIYNNIGNLYCACGEYESAEEYFHIASRQIGTESFKAATLNNLGVVYCEKKEFDTALSFFEKAYELRKSVNDSVLYDEWNNIGYANYELGDFKKASEYYDLALENAEMFQRVEKRSRILTNKGRLNFATSHYDSASYYYHKSNELAISSGLLDMVAENYFFLSEMHEKRNAYESALSYYKEYVSIKDSLFDASRYGIAKQFHFTREMSKIETQLKKVVELHLLSKEKLRTKNKIQALITFILVLTILFLFLLYRKNKNLKRAYQELVHKNIETVRSQEFYKQYRERYETALKEKEERISYLSDFIKENGLSSPLEVNTDINHEPVKYRNSSLKDEYKTDLIFAVEAVMEKPEVFCDPEFSLDKLADLVDSNSNYISQIINERFHKNFRLYINEYRIREACKLMSDPDNYRYSIETIASMVGFKSKSSFNLLFKKIVGVTPSFYLKSIKEQQY